MAEQQHVLVDFENIQLQSFDELKDFPCLIKVFLGTTQARLPLAIVRTMQAFGERVEYIQIDGSGPNALDFHIAYYLGHMSARDPATRFHIISKDTGFDPLIRHLRKQGISCQRVTSIREIITAREKIDIPLPEQIEKVIDNLSRRKATRPATIRTLRSSVNALFGKKLSTEQLEELFSALKAQQIITVTAGKLSYGDRVSSS